MSKRVKIMLSTNSVFRLRNSFHLHNKSHENKLTIHSSAREQHLNKWNFAQRSGR